LLYLIDGGRQIRLGLGDLERGFLDLGGILFHGGLERLDLGDTRLQGLYLCYGPIDPAG